VDKALNAADMIISARGFGMVVSDLGDIGPHLARKIPLDLMTYLEHNPVDFRRIVRKAILRNYWRSRMQSLGLVEQGTIVDHETDANREPATPYETYKIPEYANQAAIAPKWISMILGSTAINAVLVGFGVSLHFIFGMAIPIILQVIGRSLFGRHQLLLAVIAWLLMAGVYALFFFLWKMALQGKAWPSYLVLAFYLPDLFLFIRGKNGIEVLCHLIAIGYILYGLVGATRLSRSLAKLRKAKVRESSVTQIARAS
jgi:hypothetical protein